MGMINATDYPSYAKAVPVDDYGRPIEVPVDGDLKSDEKKEEAE